LAAAIKSNSASSSTGTTLLDGRHENKGREVMGSGKFCLNGHLQVMTRGQRNHTIQKHPSGRRPSANGIEQAK
jgi:hypothetical protein